MLSIVPVLVHVELLGYNDGVRLGQGVSRA